MFGIGFVHRVISRQIDQYINGHLISIKEIPKESNRINLGEFQGNILTTELSI